MTEEIIDVNTVFGFWPLRKVASSLENLLEIMKKHNVAQALSLSTRGIFYDFKEGNEETLAISKKHPEIIPAATINLKEYCDYYKELKKIEEQGFKALRLFPLTFGTNSWPIDYAPFRKLLKVLNEFSLPLIMPRLAGVTAIAREVKDLKNPVIIVGGFDVSEALAVMEDNPNIYFDTMIKTSDGIERIVEVMDAGRLVFGSNAPLDYMSSSLLSAQFADISEKDKELILNKNIKRILGGK